jgi:hypothetical protein
MSYNKNTSWNMRRVLTTVIGLLMAVNTSTKADFSIGEPVNLGLTVNSISNEQAPHISTDGLELYFSEHPGAPFRPGGYGLSDIWVTSRQTKDAPWGIPVNLGSVVNSSANDEHPSITADGLSLYFGSDRPSEAGAEDVWVTTRETKDSPWGKPVNLGSTVNSSYSDWEPDISADGLSLYFGDYQSPRPGGHGAWDIYQSTRSTPSDPWSVPVNLGPIVNSSGIDAGADISVNGLTLFLTTTRPGGFGGADIWMTTRKTQTDDWQLPLNLGPLVNTSGFDAMADITSDGSTLYFCSERPGGSGNVDLWQVSIEPVVDFNGDDHVNVQDLILLIEHWGQNEPAYDMGPMPWGDGIIDGADLEVLMRYWGQDDGLIAHWKLDETGGDIAYDSNGKYHAAVIGDPTWQRESGQIDGALEFDGVDDYLAAPFILDPVKQPFSAFAWIKGGQPGQSIISQQGGFGVWLSVDSTGALATGLTFPMPAVTSDVVVTDDQWHRVGLVSDGSGMSLYVDDVEVARTPTSPILPANGDLQIGAGKNLEPDVFWEGLIDDVRVYDRVVVP